MHSSDIERVDSLREDGENLRKNEQYQSAIPLLEESWEIYKKHGLSGKNARLPIHIADCYMYLNMYDIALSKLKEAKKNAEDNKLIEALVACYNKLGMIYLAQKQNVQALDNFESALIIYHELKIDIDVAIALQNVGLTLMRLNEDEIGLKYLKTSLKMFIRLGATENAVVLRKQIEGLTGFKP